MQIKICILFFACVCGYPMHPTNLQYFQPMSFMKVKRMQPPEDLVNNFILEPMPNLMPIQQIPQMKEMPSVPITMMANPSMNLHSTIILNNTRTASSNRDYVVNRNQLNNTRKSERQEEEEDEEEGGGGLGGLLTSFLGSLSTPEGGVDLDAVTGLLGGISTQNEDGTYDFSGLQDTVGSLFGGSEEGGSNVGLFLGGLIGAIIRGSAGDEAAKGAGKLSGNVLNAILPGLSAYPTPEEGPNGEPGKAQDGLDSGGFLTGFLSTVLGTIGGLSNSNSSGGGGGGGTDGMEGQKPALVQIKFQLVKAVFSLLTKILGASSSSKGGH